MKSKSMSPTKKSHSPSSSTVSNKRSKLVNPSFADLPSSLVNPSFADLPSCLLEVIMSRLELKDNIRASTACKPWLEAGVAVRVVEQHPWLMCFPKRGSSFELRDPLKWKPYTLELPELADSTVRYAKDGWLLMERSNEDEVFFFNPFTRELISLPKLKLAYGQFAFSCAPASDNCVVVALESKRDIVTISTSYPGGTGWNSSDFPTFYSSITNIVYLNERFYCYEGFKAEGEGLYSFDPFIHTWEYHPATYGCFDVRGDPYGYEQSACLAENNGKLFLILTSRHEKRPVVYDQRISDGGMEFWGEMSDARLDGFTFFASLYNSEVRKNLPWVRDNICFSRSGRKRKRCASYSFKERSYNTAKEWEDWLELCPAGSIWIDPPKNILKYL
ncbi:unnamed protein product [Microthlaspi erraticum]|uniref:KIB1-4 beta-propeller domain-containing protein n=1 Tax=Microthlaspi erraticum TaxID=1685480 RepID=A0A6D2HPU5_9BRAS|nr:unnamed protein product [Microthlaspi erraticum]